MELSLSKRTTGAEKGVPSALRPKVFSVVLVFLATGREVRSLSLDRGSRVPHGRGLRRRRRRRVQHRKQAKVQIWQIEQQLFERRILQESRNVAFHHRKHDRPEPVLALEAQTVRRVLVHSADGLDQVSVISQHSLSVEGFLNAQLCKSAQVRDVVLGQFEHRSLCQRVRHRGRGHGVLAEREVVEVVDQSGEDCRIIGGEVESSRVCLLHDEGMLGYRIDRVMWRQKSCSYLELPTEEFAKVLRLDPEDGLVDLPLLVVTCDGEIGEETLCQDAIMSLAYSQDLPVVGSHTS